MHSASFFRLKQLLRRAAAGDELTVGFLGGSITQGSLSSTPETCGQPSLPGWCWTVTRRTPFFWTPTLQRIGATVSICSPSFTTASKSSTPWS